MRINIYKQKMQHCISIYLYVFIYNIYLYFSLITNHANMFMYYLKMLYILIFFHVYGLPDICLDSTRLVFQAERHIELSEYISTLRSQSAL